MKSKIAIGALAVAALLASPLAADARSHKHHKHSSETTGANMKPGANDGTANPSGQGNVGSGTNNNSPAPSAK